MQYLLFIVISQALAAEWRDPHDMNPTNFQTVLNSEVFDPVVLKTTNDCSCRDYELVTVYLKRIVGLLVTSAVSSDDITPDLKGFYIFDKEDYKFLKKFSTIETVDQNHLRQLETILNAAFYKKTSDEILRILVTTSHNVTSLLDIRAAIFIGVLISLYILYYLLKTNFSFTYIFKYFLFIMWIIDYGHRYQTLIEEAELHNLNIDASKCKEQNWLEKLFLGADKKCGKKVVSPLQVALQQLEHIIIIPLSAFGTGTGKFMQEIWDQLGYWKIVLFPVTLVFIIILVPAMMTIVNGKPFKINIMHIFHLQYGQSDTPSNQFNERLLEKLLDGMAQRPSLRYSRAPSTSKTIKKSKQKENGNRQWRAPFKSKDKPNLMVKGAPKEEDKELPVGIPCFMSEPDVNDLSGYRKENVLFKMGGRLVWDTLDTNESYKWDATMKTCFVSLELPFRKVPANLAE